MAEPKSAKCRGASPEVPSFGVVDLNNPSDCLPGSEVPLFNVVELNSLSDSLQGPEVPLFGVVEPNSLSDCLPAPEVSLWGVTEALRPEFPEELAQTLSGIAKGMASADLPLLGVADHNCPKRLKAPGVFLTGVVQPLSLEYLVVALEVPLLGVAEALLTSEPLVAVEPRPRRRPLYLHQSVSVSDEAGESGKGSFWRRRAATLVRQRRTVSSLSVSLSLPLSAIVPVNWHCLGLLTRLRTT